MVKTKLNNDMYYDKYSKNAYLLGTLPCASLAAVSVLA